MDHESVYRSGLSADMGDGTLVLGTSTQWSFAWYKGSMVDCHLAVAFLSPMFLFRMVFTSRSAWYVFCNGYSSTLVNPAQDYYRQTPPKVPNFMKTLFRRKLVLWFLASEILRDYWLSGVSVDCV